MSYRLIIKVDGTILVNELDIDINISVEEVYKNAIIGLGIEEENVVIEISEE